MGDEALAKLADLGFQPAFSSALSGVKPDPPPKGLLYILSFSSSTHA